MKLAVPLSIVLLLNFVAVIRAYTYRAQVSTEDGYCEFDNKRAAVGETFYDDERCEKLFCGSGQVSAIGCGKVAGPPECRLERGEGRYPDCCERVVCD